MSFLPSPFNQQPRKEAQQSVDDELLVFGYSCKLYRDDRKAEMEDSGALLIPWMGDSSLMIDRYDIRNRLEDKAQFGIKPILPQRMSQEEEKMEKELDRERYLALDNDILEVELKAEEEEKRMYENIAAEGTFHAVGLHYGGEKEIVAEDETVMVNQPQLPEYLPTTSVDFLEEGIEPYVPPVELDLPEGLMTPVTQRIHSIIERTARFICLQGQQMEIIIKTKQTFNPYFSFLIPEDRLYSYYQWLLHAISSGEYPGPRTETMSESKTKAGDDSQLLVNREVYEQGKKEQDRNRTFQGRDGVEEAKEEESDSDDDSDEEGFELHPLLRTSLSRKKPPSPPKMPAPDKEPVAASGIGSFVSPISSKAFRHIALSMNSTPALAPSAKSSGMQPHLPPHPQEHPGTAAQLALPTPTSNGTGYPLPYPAAHPSSAPVYPAYGFPVYDLTAAYYQASHQYMTSPAPSIPGPIPPPPDIQPIVIKTAEYVAKNGESFEKTVLEKHLDDPRFEFLSPWHRFHAYYKMKIAETRQRLQQLSQSVQTSHHQHQQTSLPVTPALDGGVEEVPSSSYPQLDNVQRLNSDGTVSFKLTSKPARVLPPRLDLGGEEEEEDRDEEGKSRTDAGQNGEGEPEAKRPRVEPSSQHSDMLDDKVQEFLVTVKAMLY